MEMSNPRSVVEQPLGLLDLTFNLPPYSKTYRKLIEKAIRRSDPRAPRPASVAACP